MEKGVTYKSSQGLYPQVNDVELFKDSKDHIWFGLSLEILESNIVKLRLITSGKPNVEVYHTCFLKLVYWSYHKGCHLNIDMSYTWTLYSRWTTWPIDARWLSTLVDVSQESMDIIQMYP